MIEYRQADITEAKAIADLYDKAFYGYRFHDLLALGVKKKDKFIRAFLFVNIKVYIKRRGCFVGVENGRIVSSVLLKRCGEKEPRLIDYILSGGTKLLFMAGVSKLKNLFSALDEAEKECRNYYETSNQNVWFLEQIAVDALLKGQGLGSKIIGDFVIPLIRERGGDALTLITNSEENRIFYKKNRFEEFSQSVIKRENFEIGNFSFRRVI